MDEHVALITLGSLFVVGLLASEIGRRTRLPRVTLIILSGLAAGPTGFDLIPSEVIDWNLFISSMALTMVAFLLGGSLSRDEFRRHGRQIIIISLTIVVVTVGFVSLGLLALGLPPVMALLLAGIATATAPAATLDILKQLGAQGEFAETLKGIVAVDDLWGMIVFSVLLVFANALNGLETAALIQLGASEILGAVAIGCALGFPASAITGRISNGEPIQAEALAIVCLCAGLSLWLEVSYLLAGLVAGAIVVNFAKHHTRPFHEIENIEWPFMVLFFFMAGVSLHTPEINDFIVPIAAYVGLRILARLIGAWAGSRLSDASAIYQKWMGLALMPQAGVAIGMALIATHHFPDVGEDILIITVASAIVFEIYGPFATRFSVEKATKAEQEKQRQGDGGT